MQAPAARPSRPSVRFTALLVPATISQISTTASTIGSTSQSISRRNEILVDGRSAAVVVLEPRRERERAEDQRHGGLADHLGPRVETEAPAAGDADVVVEEADQSQAGEQEQQQPGRRRRHVHRDDLGHEVPGERGEDDDEAAHGRRAPLGVVAGRAVVADLLAVAPLREPLDRRPGADQRDQEAQAAAEEDRSHRALPPSVSSSCSATHSRAAPREAFTRTTSPRPAFSRTQSSASDRLAVATT